MMMLPRWVVYPEVPLPIQNLLLQHNWNHILTVADTDDERSVGESDCPVQRRV